MTLPVSIAVVVAVPVLIGQAAKPEAPAPPDPKEAALEVQLSGDQGTSKPKLVRIAAAGIPPASTTLRSADGTETGQVNSVATTNCAKEKVRDLGLAADQSGDWCLQLSGFTKHSELSGTVTGTATPGSDLAPTALALTVRHRDTFWWGPFLILAAGILVSIGIALALATLVSAIGKGRLGALLAANRVAGPTDQIAGLDEWVATQKDKDTKDLRDLLAPIVKDGPAKARTARASLATALSQYPLGQHPLQDAAEQEVARSDHKVTDFLTPDGTQREHHPADEFAAALKTMHDYKENLDQAAANIEQLNEQCRNEPDAAMELARKRWAAISDPGAVDSLANYFKEMNDLIDKKVADSDCVKVSLSDRVGAVTDFLSGGLTTYTTPRRLRIPRIPEVSRTAPRALKLDKAKVWRTLLAAGLFGTGLAIVVAVAFATLTVEQATYEANATFGSFSDYFGLFSAALAAGVAGTIAGLLAPWRSGPTDAAEG